MYVNTILSVNRDIYYEASSLTTELRLPESEFKKGDKNSFSIPLSQELKCKWRISIQSHLFEASYLEFVTIYLLQQLHQIQISKTPIDFSVKKQMAVSSGSRKLYEQI